MKKKGEMRMQEIKSPPPLGIMPANIWREKCNRERLSALLAAMARFTEAEKPVPSEWIQEVWELTLGSQEKE